MPARRNDYSERGLWFIMAMVKMGAGRSALKIPLINLNGGVESAAGSTGAGGRRERGGGGVRRGIVANFCQAVCWK